MRPTSVRRFASAFVRVAGSISPCALLVKFSLAHEARASALGLPTSRSFLSLALPSHFELQSSALWVAPARPHLAGTCTRKKAKCSTRSLGTFRRGSLLPLVGRQGHGLQCLSNFFFLPGLLLIPQLQLRCLCNPPRIGNLRQCNLESIFPVKHHPLFAARWRYMSSNSPVQPCGLYLRQLFTSTMCRSIVRRTACGDCTQWLTFFM